MTVVKLCPVNKRYWTIVSTQLPDSVTIAVKMFIPLPRGKIIIRTLGTFGNVQMLTSQYGLAFQIQIDAYL